MKIKFELIKWDLQYAVSELITTLTNVGCYDNFY